jgi:hypothetical protein
MEENNQQSINASEQEKIDNPIPDSVLNSLSTEEKKKRVRDLNKMIKKRESILTGVNSRIDLLRPVEGKFNNLKQEHDELFPAVELLRTKKENYEQEIPELEAKHETAETSLTKIIVELKSNEETKSSLDDEISDLTITRDRINFDIETSKADEALLNQSRNQLKTEIAALNIEQEKIKNEIVTLRDKLGLYSKDLTEIVRQNRGHRIKYAWAIAVTFSLALIFIYTLISLMKSDDLIPKSVQVLFGNSINYLFYESILIRTSILGGLIFIILVFINLTRGFVSQYIRSQEKIGAITVLDFLVSRLESKQFTFTDDNLKRDYAKDVLKSQIDLMSTHLPRIMEDTSTNFDRTTKTNSPIDSINESLKEITKKINS